MSMVAVLNVTLILRKALHNKSYMLFDYRSINPH